MIKILRARSRGAPAGAAGVETAVNWKTLCAQWLETAKCVFDSFAFYRARPVRAAVRFPGAGNRLPKPWLIPSARR